MKRFLIITFSALCALVFSPQKTHADIDWNAEKIGDLYYCLSGDEAGVASRLHTYVDYWGSTLTDLLSGKGFHLKGKTVIPLWNDYSFEEIVIPSEIEFEGKKYKVTWIASDAFNSCKNLKRVTLPNTIKAIGAAAFYNCNNLTTVNIQSGVKTIYDEAFYNCYKLTTVNIPSSVEVICSAAFHNCRNLTGTINIPEGVTRIEEYAFDGCNNLTVNVPSSVEFIGKCAFKNCDIVDISSSKISSIEAETFYGCNNLTVNIPESVRRIKARAFYFCDNLTTVNIPEGVTTIDDEVFLWCENLTTVNIPSSVTFIGENVFKGTSISKEIESSVENGLYYWDNCLLVSGSDISDNVVVKEGTRLIARSAFRDNKKLVSITLPSSLKAISSYAFQNCEKLQDIYCSSTLQIWSTTFSGVDASKVTIHTLDCYKPFYEKRKLWEGFKFEFSPALKDGIYYSLDGNKLTATVIAEKTGADNYESLPAEKVYIPKKITEGEGRDKKDYQVTGMQEDAFAYSPFSYVEIHSAAKITTIPQGAFRYATQLKDVVIYPVSIAKIEESAFQGCAALEYIPGLTDYREKFFPNLDKIGNKAFKDCVMLPILYLASATTIGEEAFSGCTGLKEVTIGSQVKQIGARAFEKCYGLEKFTNHALKPQPFAGDMISDVDKDKFIVYVHRESLEAYKAAAGWKQFTILPISGEEYEYTVHTLCNDKKAGTITGDGTYKENTSATVTAKANDGFHFLSWSNGATDNPYTFTVTEDIALTAFFEADVKSYTVNVVSADAAMGTVSGGGENIKAGTKITITATPKSGYEFAYWTDIQGLKISSNASLTVDVATAETYTAYFRAIPDYTSYNIYLNGTQITSDNQNDVLGDGVWTYNEMTNTLTTMAKKTYSLTDKDFISNYLKTPLNIVLNHSITINASTTDTGNDILIYSPYGLNFHGTPVNRLTINCTDMRVIYTSFGLVTVNDLVQINITQTVTSWGEANIKPYLMEIKDTEGGFTINGADVYLGVKGSSAFKVSNLTADKLSVTDATVEDGALDDISLYVSNDKERHQLHYNNGDLVYICPVSGFGFFYPGQIRTLLAEPFGGYSFVRWSDGNTDNPRVITMPDKDLFIDPVIELTDAELAGAVVDIVPAGEGGSVSGYSVGWYATGTKLTISALPESGYEFMEWSDGNTDNPRLITVEAGKNINLKAVFDQKAPYIVTFLGLHDEELKIEKVREGLYATAPEAPEYQGYTFLGWDPYNFSEINSDLTVKAQYESVKCRVRFLMPDGIIPIDETIVNWGDAAVAPETPEVEGQTFVGWDMNFDNVTEDMDVIAKYEAIILNVKFTDWDNTVLSQQDVEYGYHAELPDMPTREGHSFIGWEGNYMYVTSDVTITAVYEINTYTVTFHGFNDVELKVEEVEHGKSATAPEAPEIEGYEFKGWDKDFSSVTSDLLVNAQYSLKIVYHTVTFIGFDNLVLKEEQIQEGGSATAPEAPAVEHYTFTGWDKDFTSVSSDITVTAVYEIDKFTVTFYGMGGLWLEDQQVPYGESAKAPEAPEIEGYEFKGWDTDFTNVTGDLTVNAIYESTVITHKLTLSVEGKGKIFLGVYNDLNELQETEATETSYDLPEGSQFLLIAKADEGWQFDSWKDGETKAQREITLNTDLSLTAVFTEIPVITTYTVTFLGFNDEILKTQTVNEGEAASAPDAPIVEGYEFKGWEPADFTNVKSNLTVKALYEEIIVIPTTYTVTFLGFNDEVLKTQTVNEGEAATAPEAPAVEGYEFKGWEPADFSNVKSDLTVKALYEKKEIIPTTYTVTFLGFNDEILKTQTVNEGEAATAPDAPAVEGYEFKGWEPADFSNVKSDLTVKALYEEKEVIPTTYTVTFLGFNDEVLKTQTVNEGEAATAPEAPAVEGYEFKGWDTDFTNVTSDLTVKALYEKKEVIPTTYTVTFLGFNDEVLKTQTVNEGEAATAPEAPAVEGYEFKGWDTDFTNVTSNLTVKALYEKKEVIPTTYTVTFLGFNDEVLKTQTVNEGEAATAPEAPAVEGYEFKGWDTDFTNVTSNLTVKALYEEIIVIDYTPQNLKVETTAVDEDTQISLSWDAVEGVAAYELQVLYNGKPIFAGNIGDKHELTLMLSDLLKEMSDVASGVYTLQWQVRSLDAENTPLSEWADGESFKITIKQDTAIENTEAVDNQPHARKVLRNGRIIILLPDGKEFDATGAEVR